MANPKSTLWLRLEGQPSPTKLKFRNSDMDSEDPDLADLAELLCKKNNHLKTLNVVPAYLQFLGDYDGADNDERNPDGTLRLDIFVRALRTSAKSPLVVRHPLSDDRIVVNLKLVKSSREITLSHTTGTWHMLLDEATSVYPILLSDRSNIYFVDPGDKKKTIAKEFDFNKLLEKTDNDEGSRVVNFIVRIKGKKAYGDWNLNEVLNEILLKRYPSLNAIPELKLDEIKTRAKLLDGDNETTFVNNLKDIASSFHNNVTTNKATARNYINAFMHKAVAML
ncbi:hypothetical protein BC938DRAFT_477363, partial [Jimgerdemannia flammicorona]